MSEADLIPLSALQHYLYCPRQCALIHVEQQWAENRYTAEGRILHDRTNTPGSESRPGVKTVRAMPIRSFRLGIAGVADVVELREENGRARPSPVEYKRGRPKAHRADEVQLCAQAIALEEMLGTEIPEGRLFYGKTRRRQTIVFDAELRGLTDYVATQTRALIASGVTPPPQYERPKCEKCSLLELCQPKCLARRTEVAKWIERQVEGT
jgi:CRISPR-associated exonuclease Cas4